MPSSSDLTPSVDVTHARRQCHVARPDDAIGRTELSCASTTSVDHLVALLESSPVAIIDTGDLDLAHEAGGAVVIEPVRRK